MATTDPKNRKPGQAYAASLNTRDPKKIFNPDFNAYNATPSFPYAPADLHTVPNTGEESTRIILDYGFFLRPWIGDEDGVFVWPEGMENFHLEGNAVIGIHKYLGTANIDATIQHYDEPHITISGMFRGSSNTMINNMNGLRMQLIRSSKNGKMLFIPGWTRLRYVACEGYTFDYQTDNTGGGITYSASFVVTGVGTQVDDVARGRPKLNIGNKGKTHKTYTVNTAHRTLRQIAQVLWKNGDKWKLLYDLNKDADFMNDWRPGMKLPLVYPAGSKKPVKIIYS